MLLASSGLILAQSLENAAGAAVTNPASSAVRPVASVTPPRLDLLLGPRMEPAVLAQARAMVAERRLTASVVPRPASAATHPWSNRRAAWPTGTRSPRAERFRAGLDQARLAAKQRAVVVTGAGSFTAAERRVFLRNQEENTPAEQSPAERP